MFRVGMGIEGSSVAFPALPPPLQRQLAAVGIAAADMPCSRRPPIAGFVIAVATMVKAAATDGHASGILQDHLQVRMPGTLCCGLSILVALPGRVVLNGTWPQASWLMGTGSFSCRFYCLAC